MGITERIDNITDIPPKYYAKNIPAPESVKIELTGRCNFACSFCARSMKLRSQKDMDRAFYSKIIRQMRHAGVKELGLFYLGESFMLPWLPDAIREAKGIGFPYTFLTTNGSLANGSKVEACMVAGLDSLKWSYNYCDAAQLEEIAGVKGRYFGIMQKNMRDAWSVREAGGYQCGLYASYIEYDGEQGERMAEAVDVIRPYVDEVYGLPLYNQAALVSERLDLEHKDWTPSVGNKGRLGALRPGLPCWACFTEGHITWDGYLSACCFGHTPEFNMGDLNEMRFMEAWNSFDFMRLRGAHLNEDVTGTACENCLAYQ